MKTMADIKRVALVYWGKSRETKCITSETIDSLKKDVEKLGYECTLYILGADSFAKQIITDQPDFVLNYTPGDYGEDGRLSGFLEIVGIPYSHPGWYHHAVSIHKPTAKILFRNNGLDCA
jgi:D-alanine-D-alanine ligase